MVTRPEDVCDKGKACWCTNYWMTPLGAMVWKKPKDADVAGERLRWLEIEPVNVGGER